MLFDEVNHGERESLNYLVFMISDAKRHIQININKVTIP